MQTRTYRLVATTAAFLWVVGGGFLPAGGGRVVRSVRLVGDSAVGAGECGAGECGSVGVFAVLEGFAEFVSFGPQAAYAEGDWEITPESEAALHRGLEWLANNQGPEGNWDSNDLGLVSLGVLAFLADGHTPDRGRYGETVRRGLDYIMQRAKPSGLLNIADGRRDMYNHGLTTFVLGQAYGMTNDQRLSRVLDRALKLIADTQAKDGGWDYTARRTNYGHDLSLVVMQAKALRSAVDSGLEIRGDVVERAIQYVRGTYRAENGANRQDDPRIRMGGGQFTYDGGRGTTAMAAAGVVCLQEFGQYDDWRIPKSMDVVRKDVLSLARKKASEGRLPLDAYTLYYVGQATYQVGGEYWTECYPVLRDKLVESQRRAAGNLAEDGSWVDTKHIGSGRVGRLFGTSVACFVLAIPNRYLPILQEGRIESLKGSE